MVPSAPPQPSRTTLNVPSASGAARAQRAGFACLDEMERQLERSLSNESIPSTPLTPEAEPSSLSPEEREAALLAEDKVAVLAEWTRYIDEGVIDKSEMEDFDLLRYWQVS